MRWLHQYSGIPVDLIKQKNGTDENKSHLSHLVLRRGIEPLLLDRKSSVLAVIREKVKLSKTNGSAGTEHFSEKQFLCYFSRNQNLFLLDLVIFFCCPNRIRTYNARTKVLSAAVILQGNFCEKQLLHYFSRNQNPLYWTWSYCLLLPQQDSNL